MHRFIPTAVFAEEGEGGTPAPETSKEAPTDSNAPAPLGEEHQDYEGLDPSFDIDGEIEIELPKVDAKPEETPPPKAPDETTKGEDKTSDKAAAKDAQPSKAPEEPPKEPVAEKVEEKKPEGEKPAAPATATSEEPSSLPPGPIDLAQQLQTHKAAMIDALASERFALSKEEQDALEEDAVAVIPKLLARVALESSTIALNQIGTLVPQMIQQHMQVQAAASAAEQEFYSMFSHLNPGEHGAAVRDFATAFRSATPNIDKETLYAMVGAAVSAKYGAYPQQQTQKAASNGGGAPPKPQSTPFVPARQGATVQLEREENPFAGLGQDFDE